VFKNVTAVEKPDECVVFETRTEKRGIEDELDRICSIGKVIEFSYENQTRKIV
jgi:hypothetical protein